MTSGLSYRRERQKGEKVVRAYTLQVIVRLLAVKWGGSRPKNFKQVEASLMVSTFRKFFWFQEIGLKEPQQG